MTPTVKDPEALQYIWYVEYDKEEHGPPDPSWELDMAIDVETDVRGRYTTTKFYSQSNDDAWIRADKTVSLSAVR